MYNCSYFLQWYCTLKGNWPWKCITFIFFFDLLHFTASSVTKIQVWHSKKSPPSSSLLACRQRCCLWLRQQLDEQRVTSVSDVIKLYFHLSLSSTPDHLLLLYTCSATGQHVPPSFFSMIRPLLFLCACHWFDVSIWSPQLPPFLHLHILELFLLPARVIILP